MFANEDFIFGDNPTMRWYVNNCYQQLDAKGNTTYLKIEPQTRKTDGFFLGIGHEPNTKFLKGQITLGGQHGDADFNPIT